MPPTYASSMPSSMLRSISNPKILSSFCFEYSGLFDPTLYKKGSTPRDMSLSLPETFKNAVHKRQAEYCAGRFAARAALRSAGFLDDFEIRSNLDRSPIWPEKYVGSITHTSNYVSAVVAKKEHVRALGRDTEGIFDDITAENIKDRVASYDELTLQDSSGLNRSEFIGVLFSAKESVFKAIGPIIEKYFYFEDVKAIDVSEFGIIQFELLRDLGFEFKKGLKVQARYQIDKFIHTSVEIAKLGSNSGRS